LGWGWEGRLGQYGSGMEASATATDAPVVLLDDGGALRHAGSAQDLEVNRSSD
jgi:hypothetical protein